MVYVDKTILFYTVYCSIILYVLLKQMKCHAVVFLLHAMITSWLGPCVCLCGGGVRFGKNRCKYFDKSDFRWQGKDKILRLQFSCWLDAIRSINILIESFTRQKVGKSRKIILARLLDKHM